MSSFVKAKCLKHQSGQKWEIWANFCTNMLAIYMAPNSILMWTPGPLGTSYLRPAVAALHFRNDSWKEKQAMLFSFLGIDTCCLAPVCWTCALFTLDKYILQFGQISYVKYICMICKIRLSVTVLHHIMGQSSLAVRFLRNRLDKLLESRLHLANATVQWLQTRGETHLI